MQLICFLLRTYSKFKKKKKENKKEKKVQTNETHTHMTEKISLGLPGLLLVSKHGPATGDLTLPGMD